MSRQAEAFENWSITGTNTGTITFNHAVVIIGMHVTYTSDATVGNRVLKLSINDLSAVKIMDSYAGLVQAASLVRSYEFVNGVHRETAFINGSVQVPIATGFVIPAGGSIIVNDASAISATDSYIAKIQTERLY